MAALEPDFGPCLEGAFQNRLSLPDRRRKPVSASAQRLANLKNAKIHLDSPIIVMDEDDIVRLEDHYGRTNESSKKTS